MYNTYESNYSTEEFLDRAFILMGKKLKDICSLIDSVDYHDISKRYQKTSELIEAISLLQSSLDESKKEFNDLFNLYGYLIQLVFEGNNTKSKEKIQTAISIIEKQIT